MYMFYARPRREAHIVADIVRRRVAVSVERVEADRDKRVELLLFFPGVLADIRDVPPGEYYQMPWVIRIQVERYDKVLCLVNDQLVDIFGVVADETEYAPFRPFPLEVCYFVETEQIFHMRL